MKFRKNCEPVRKISKYAPEVKANVTSQKQNIEYHEVNSVLKRPGVIDYLQTLHSKFIFVPIDKAANNISIICKHFYVEVIFEEIIGIIGEGNNTYYK